MNPETKKLYISTPAIGKEENYEIPKGAKYLEETTIEIEKGLVSFSTITVPESRVFIVGGKYGDGKVSNQIYEVDLKKKAGVPFCALRTARVNPTVTYGLRTLYIIGGEDEFGVSLPSCEEVKLEGKILSSDLPPLSEGKTFMAACVFWQRLYVFGGELNFSPERKPTKILHDYSDKIEYLDLKAKESWTVVTLDSASQALWGGCGMSTAIPINDSILIFGGCISLEDKDDYITGVCQIPFYPKSNTFGKQEMISYLGMEYCTTPAYNLKDDVIVVCSSFPRLGGKQTFYCGNPKGELQWSCHNTSSE